MIDLNLHGDIGRTENNVMNDEPECILNLRDEGDLSGTVVPLRYAESLLPEGKGRAEVSMKIVDEPTGTAQKITATTSVAEFRADYYGTRHSPFFVLRQIGSSDYDRRIGCFSIEEPTVIDALEIIDTSLDKTSITDSPLESCFVTIEIDVSENTD